MLSRGDLPVKIEVSCPKLQPEENATPKIGKIGTAAMRIAAGISVYAAAAFRPFT